MSLYEYDVAESDSITAGDMVAVNEGGEVEALRTARAWYQTRPTDAQTWQARNRAMVQDYRPPQGKYARAQATMRGYTAETIIVDDPLARIDDEPMTPEKRAAVTRWYTESMATRIDSDRAAMIDRMNRTIPSIAATVRKDGPPRSEYERAKDRADFIFAREMARYGEGSPDMPDAVQPLAVGEEVTFPDGSRGRVVGVEGRNVSVQTRGVINSISISMTAIMRPRPDHELRILRQLDLARLHRVTAEDIRARCSLSDSAIPLDAPSGGLCKGRWRATRSQVCDDTRVRCRGALGLYAPVLRPNIGMRWSLCRSEGVYLTDWCVRMRWRCTTLRLTGMVSL